MMACCCINGIWQLLQYLCLSCISIFSSFLQLLVLHLLWSTRQISMWINLHHEHHSSTFWCWVLMEGLLSVGWTLKCTDFFPFYQMDEGHYVLMGDVFTSSLTDQKQQEPVKLCSDGVVCFCSHGVPIPVRGNVRYRTWLTEHYLDGIDFFIFHSLQNLLIRLLRFTCGGEHVHRWFTRAHKQQVNSENKWDRVWLSHIHSALNQWAAKFCFSRCKFTTQTDLFVPSLSYTQGMLVKLPLGGLLTIW